MIHSDIFFISYDEPNADKCWEKVLSTTPGAKRVHGIKGFDSAYKACAIKSKFDRFFTIDGDNEILPSFSNVNINWNDIRDTDVLSWSSINCINGLIYGNGGVKNWPKKVVEAMCTHEAATQSDSGVDFCYQLNYLQMPEPISVAKINESPYQAFRAGFREGVKMLLPRGEKIVLQQGQSLPNRIREEVWFENLNRLKIWCSVGADVSNGLWSIFGASLGANMVYSDWNHNLIRDYDWFSEFWREVHKNTKNLAVAVADQHILLQKNMGLEVSLLSAEASVFFKSVYVNPKRSGYMFK